MMAEAYWEEYHLQQMGFDFVYDKPLYNKLEREDATSVRDHLCAGFEFQKRQTRFVENHDEQRAMKVFWPEERTRAVATLALTLPGMRLLHQGQIKGRRVRSPVQLCRWQPEPLSRTSRSLVFDWSFYRQGISRGHFVRR